MKMRDVYDVEKELRMKEERVAFWERHHHLPKADDLVSMPMLRYEVGA
ncbi:hypothetical protein JW711_01710 [Candidatus Woesearchaeota archaeon]|nr:hypothetical protein [Candidatus Woesearchaeota archaeon]